MRRTEVLAGRISWASVDLEGNGPEGLVVGAVAAGIVATAPASRLISTFVPGSTHWPCCCPWSVSFRSQAPGPPSGGVVAASRTWSECVQNASAAGWRRRSWFGIGRGRERCRICWSRRHPVEDVDRSPAVPVSSAEAFDLVGSLPWLSWLTRGRAGRARRFNRNQASRRGCARDGFLMLE